MCNPSPQQGPTFISIEHGGCYGRRPPSNSTVRSLPSAHNSYFEVFSDTSKTSTVLSCVTGCRWPTARVRRRITTAVPSARPTPTMTLRTTPAIALDIGLRDFDLEEFDEEGDAVEISLLTDASQSFFVSIPSREGCLFVAWTEAMENSFLSWLTMRYADEKNMPPSRGIRRGSSMTDGMFRSELLRSMNPSESK